MRPYLKIWIFLFVVVIQPHVLRASIHSADHSSIILKPAPTDTTKIKRVKTKQLTRENHNVKNENWWIAGMVIIGVGLMSLASFVFIGWWAFLISAVVMITGFIISWRNKRPPPDNWLGRQLDFDASIPATVFLLAGICYALVGLILGVFALFG